MPSVWGCHHWPSRCPRALPPRKPHWFGGGCCPRLPRAISGFVVLQQPESESTSLTPVATNDYVVAWSLIGHKGPCGSTGAMLHLASSKWNVLLSVARVISGLGLQLGHLWVHSPTAVSFCVDVHGSGWHESHANSWCLGVYLQQCWCSTAVLPLRPCLSGWSASPLESIVTPDPGCCRGPCLDPWS